MSVGLGKTVAGFGRLCVALVGAEHLFCVSLASQQNVARLTILGVQTVVGTAEVAQLAEFGCVALVAGVVR